MVIHWSMVEFMPFSAYTFGNKGVYKHNSENSENSISSNSDQEEKKSIFKTVFNKIKFKL